MTWEQFLIDNNLGLTEHWPPALSKYRLKRRKFVDDEPSVSKLDANPMQNKYSQQTMLENVSISMEKENHVMINEDPVDLRNEKLIQKHDIRGNLGSKMGLIRKRAKNKFLWVEIQEPVEFQ